MKRNKSNPTRASAASMSSPIPILALSSFPFQKSNGVQQNGMINVKVQVRGKLPNLDKRDRSSFIPVGCVCSETSSAPSCSIKG